jgi:hypothetical protein
MKRTIKIMSLLVFLCFLASLVVTVQPVLAKDKDKIVIGASRSLSGPLAFFEETPSGRSIRCGLIRKTPRVGSM